MKKFLVVAICLGAFAGCASNKLSPDAAREQVNQLMTLYKENKPKFVVQKQEIEQDKNCDRATALREAIDKIAKDAAMSPDNTADITAMQMELTQAEKTCLAK